MVTIKAEVRINEYVEAEVQIDELEDDELLACVEEARRRGILGKTSKPRRERIALVYQDLVAGRTGRALTDFEAAIFDDDDFELLQAWRSMRDGKWSAAICWIDNEVFSDTPRTKSASDSPKLSLKQVE